MSLDGLRAWIGEVERKLGVRTKVMLALAAIAIGVGGTAIYLAIDTRQNAVSESDVQQLQEELEARIGTGVAGADTATLEAEIDALRAQVEALEAGGKGGGASSGSGSDGGTGTGSGVGSGAGTGTGAAPGAVTGAGPGSEIGSIPPAEGGAAASADSKRE